MKTSKQPKELLKENSKKYQSKKTEKDIALQKLLKSGGRDGAKKDFIELLKRVSQPLKK